MAALTQATYQQSKRKIQSCSECTLWAGRCLGPKRHVTRFAADSACEKAQ